MNIIIFGATELGCLIATEFFEDHDITIIDKEEKFTNNLDLPHLLTPVIIFTKSSWFFH